MREISCYRYQNHVPLDFGLPICALKTGGFLQANGIDEQRTVGKCKPQEADPRIGQNLDNRIISDVFVSFELQAYWFVM